MKSDDRVLKTNPDIILVEESEGQWLVIDTNEGNLFRANEVALQVIQRLQKSCPMRDLVDYFRICHQMSEKAVEELMMVIGQLQEFNIVVGT